MELFFKTRDLGPKCDYPAIGWMPMLHDSDQLPWIRFKDFGGVEHPQIVVSGDGDRWSIYLESLDSGRTDAPSGVGGRIIRMSLYVTGGKEDGCKIVGLVARYVRDVLRDGHEAALRDVFADCVKPGDPFHWKQDGENAQKAAADKLLKRLITVTENVNSPHADNAAFGAGAWSAGMSNDSAESFVAVCSELLAGSRRGTAVALSRMQLSNVDRMMVLPEFGSPLIAILSLSQDDQGIPLRKMGGRAKYNSGILDNAQRCPRGISQRGACSDSFRHNQGKEQNSQDCTASDSVVGSKLIGRCFFVGGMVIGAAIVILAIAKACVSDKGHNGTARQQSVSGEGGR